MRLEKPLQKLLKSKIGIALIVALIIRCSLAPLTEHRYDMYIWRLNQALAYEYHINPLIPPQEIDRNATPFFWSYPPLWLFYLLIIYPIYTSISNPIYPSNVSELWRNMYIVNSICEAYQSFIPANLPLLDFLIKLPIIVSDLLIGLLLLKITTEFAGKQKASRYLYYWIFNPYVIFISSIWGMFDSIPTLLTLWAVWLFAQKKYDKSALILASAALFKMYSIIISPILAFIYYKNEKKLFGAVKYFAIVSAFTVFVTFFSYFCSTIIFGKNSLNTSIALTWQLFKGRSSPDWEGSNIFFGLTPLTALGALFKQLNVKTNIPISPILLGLALLIILVKIRKEKNLNIVKVFSYVTIVHFTIYLTYSVVNEQYLIWILPFLLILLALNKLEMFFIYWTISIITMLFIFAHYINLSYFISPYFVSGYLEYPDYYILFGVMSAVTLLIGVKFAVRDYEGEASSAKA